MGFIPNGLGLNPKAVGTIPNGLGWNPNGLGLIPNAEFRLLPTIPPFNYSFLTPKNKF